MQVHCFMCPVILNVMATHYTYSLCRVHHPPPPRPPLTRTVKLSLSGTCSPAHCPWLPGYINVRQTILIILTVAGIFQDKPHIFFSIRVWDSSDTFPEVELLGHKAVLFLIFWGNSILLSKVAAPICIPTKVPEGSIVYWFTDERHSDKCEAIACCF